MKNLLKKLGVLAIVGMLGTQIMNVNALGVDATKCKNNAVYTNYYFLLDANTFSGSAVTSAGGVYQFMNNGWTHITQGHYTSSQILIQGLSSTGFQNYDDSLYSVQSGTIPVTNSATDGLKNWSFDDFYAAISEQKNHNGSWVTSSGKDVYVVNHSYSNVSASGEVGETIDASLSVTDASNNALKKASVILGNAPSITKVELTSSNDYATDFIVQVSRNYANPTAYDGSTFTNVSPVSLDSKNWYLNAAIFFVQYCEKGTTSEKKITYYANTTDTVTGLPSEQKGTSTECLKISSATLTRSGNKFLGWSTDSNAKSADSTYAAGKDYCKAENLQLYAVWETTTATDPTLDTPTDNSTTHTIKYDGNGGLNAPATQTKANGTCAKISTDKPTLEKNTFLGWSTDKNAKEADSKYAGGSEYCTDSDLNLYAVWQVQTGVKDYFIAFGIVAIAAGAALYVAKKKNLFKQI